MNRERSGTLYALFALLCLIWGLSWIPLKIGVTAMPPGLFAAARFSAAGALLLSIRRVLGGNACVRREDWGRLLAVALLMVTGTYGLLFWGMTRIPSGLAAVVNLGTIPLALMGAGALMRDERLTAPRVLGALVGAGGLALLFREELVVTGGGERLAGIAAAAVSSLIYAVGAVLSRDLLRRYSPVVISGWSNGLGSLFLLALSIALEPGSPGALVALGRPPVLASWLGLVLLGSAVAMTIFLRLTRDWAASRAGLYALVSPAIAVGAGALLLGERFDGVDLLAMALMLAAAVAVLMSPPPAAPRGSRRQPDPCLAALPVERVRGL